MIQVHALVSVLFNMKNSVNVLLGAFAWKRCQAVTIYIGCR
uniref:Uncharacterized protein n=1 Tax=Rhizophora mucronata TaxID=61149 RepID=A0A2P2NPT9_RHIMU